MEKWDLYDKNLNIVGEHIRGNKILGNVYHLVVHVWIKNSKGQFLISKRSANRTFNPLMWECIGGSVLKGEKSLEGALREVKEEIGLDLNPNSGKMIHFMVREKFNDIVNVWLFNYDGDVNLNNATTNEVKQTKWLYPKQIKNLDNALQLVPTLRYFFDVVLQFD